MVDRIRFRPICDGTYWTYRTYQTYGTYRTHGTYKSPSSHPSTVWVLLLWSILVSSTYAAEPTAEQLAFFQTRIAPVLAKHCYPCHSAEAVKANKLKGGLLLDTRQGVLRGGESGAILTPGKPNESPLMRALRYEELEMPPSGKLPEKVIADFAKWVEMGAPDPRVDAGSAVDALKQRAQAHWAYRPPLRPATPAVQDSTWPRNELDRFILHRLESESLHPSPEADRITLLRRASLDLIGLPPTLAEVDAFLADQSPDAYERQIDRLFASPHYGERWGRHWLDAARYADSDGYEKDKPRQVWMYRDWVIQALNRDLPYDEFVIEQIAGDLLTNATQDQIVATGFLRNSMINEEGGVDPEQFRMDAMFDRMDALGKSILGLAINCCQCHDHKFDPITQEDYYKVFAYINDTHEANVAVYSPSEKMRRSDVLRQIQELEAELKHVTPDWQQRIVAWEATVRSDAGNWQTLRVENAGDNSQRYVTHEDGSQTAWGYAPTKWSSQFRGKSDCANITGIRLELLTDPNLPLSGPGRSPIGLCALSELQVEAADAESPANKTKIKLVSATADFANDERELEKMFDDKSNKKRVTGPITMAIDGKDETAWGIDAGAGRRNVDRHAVFVPEKPIQFPKGAVLSFSLKQMHGGWNSDDNQNNNLGRFRFSVTSDPMPLADVVPRAVREICATAPEKRSGKQWDVLFSYWRTTVPEWREANRKIDVLWSQHPTATSQLAFMARESPRQSFVLTRGNFLKPAQAVQAGVPVVFHSLPETAEPNRLTLARWLVDPRAPTTARAMVNRQWQTFFGTGLVTSSEDLGVQCAPPSHPELLDWLAVEFMGQGWSMKGLQRLIVTSAAYRQSSKVTPKLLARDPENRLLARGARLRVEGEVVRDISLAASGLLQTRIGGPSVNPPAPDFLFVPPASYGPKVWHEDHGEGRYRRGLYTFRFRSVPYPMLTNFDTPNGDASCVRRVRSNTPLQALTTLNETLFMECARALAQRTLREGGASEAERMTFAFRVCVARPPSEQESNLLLAMLAKETSRFAAEGAKPWELAADDPAHPPAMPAGVSPAQAAAWTAVARVLLNMDETISKE